MNQWSRSSRRSGKTLKPIEIRVSALKSTSMGHKWIYSPYIPSIQSIYADNEFSTFLNLVEVMIVSKDLPVPPPKVGQIPNRVVMLHAMHPKSKITYQTIPKRIQMQPPSFPNLSANTIIVKMTSTQALLGHANARGIGHFEAKCS